MNYEVKGNSIIIHSPSCLSLDITLDCGQAFRWSKGIDNIWSAVVGVGDKGKYASLHQDEATNDITFFDTTEREFLDFWIPYFDLSRDYDSICTKLSTDENIGKAINDFPGIRILHQDPWETLCSFIISQNNNIPRIKGIIDRLCECFGEPLRNGSFTFPTANCLAILDETDLAPLRAGFRNKYIIDAAKKVANKEVDLYNLQNLPLDDAEAELIRIKGVGPKVAQCALLYGCGMADAFPIDVWVKRILSEMYEDGLPACTENVRGIAQQYLFHWRRNGKQWQREEIK